MKWFFLILAGNAGIIGTIYGAGSGDYGTALACFAIWALAGAMWFERDGEAG